MWMLSIFFDLWKDVHLTNVAIQKNAPDYDPDKGCKWSTQQLRKYLSAKHGVEAVRTEYYCHTIPFYLNVICLLFYVSVASIFSWLKSLPNDLCVYYMLDVHFWTLGSKLSLSCYDTRHPLIKLCTLHFSCRGNGVVYMSWDNTIFRCVLLGFIMW